MVLTWLALAHAQTVEGAGFDAHGFRLAAHDADPRDPLVGWRPGEMQPHSWFTSGVLEYANQPLVFERDGTTTVQVDDLIALNTSLGYAPHRRVRVDVSLPVYFHSQGVSGSMGAGIGDVRATGLVNLVSPTDGKGVGLGILGNLDLPTGSATEFRGQTTVSGGIGIAATGEIDRLTLTASASSQLRPNTDPDERPAPTKGGDAFAWAASVGVLVAEGTGVTVEAHGEVASDEEVRGALGIPVEAMLSMKHVRSNGGFLTAGLGVGLTRGAGASPFRLLVGGGFGRSKKPLEDMDGDGFGDFDDLCPASKETLNGYKDDDGCPDDLPRMVFRAIDPGGEVREDATIAVTGPRSEQGAGTLTFQGDGVDPGSEWHVEVEAGNCLAGKADVVMGPNGDEVDVVLERKRTGRVYVEAVDPDGKPIQRAQVRFRTEETPCAPSLPSDLGDGTAEVPVGPGMFFAFVTAPGFNVYQEMFTIEPKGRHTIRATLQPSLAAVAENDDGSRFIELRAPITFENGTASIENASYGLLDEIANVILTEPLTRVEIGAHTDDRGDDAANLELSQERADAVKAHLMARGVDVMALTSVGYGETRPLVPNRNAASRAKNARVELRILE